MTVFFPRWVRRRLVFAHMQIPSVYSYGFQAVYVESFGSFHSSHTCLTYTELLKSSRRGHYVTQREESGCCCNPGQPLRQLPVRAGLHARNSMPAIMRACLGRFSRSTFCPPQEAAHGVMEQRSFGTRVGTNYVHSASYTCIQRAMLSRLGTSSFANVYN